MSRAWRNFRGDRSSLVLCALTALAAVGCTRTEAPSFRLNMVQMADYGLNGEQRETIATTLVAMFGTPDEPFVFPESGLDLARLQRSAGPVKSEDPNSQAGLYRRHCAHCHGITGDGQGPTARFLNPYPRDYRQGIFKFKSTTQASKPTREDLRRILDHGVPGTAMPSFLLLKESEKEDLIEYVIYLSMRGETEISMASAVFDLTEGTPAEIQKDLIQPDVLVQGTLTEIADKWNAAAENVVRPDPAAAPTDQRTTAEIMVSAEKGRALFFGERAGCVKCHGRTALGDGQTNDFDVWNKQVFLFGEKLLKEPEPLDLPSSMPAEKRKEAEEAQRAAVEAYNSPEEQFKREVYAAALPPRNLIPRNLRGGVYRGGRRPIDIFRKISVGIEGALMPAGAKKDPEAKVGLSQEEIWQLVDYVHSLPYEPASRPPDSWIEWAEEHQSSGGGALPPVSR